MRKLPPRIQATSALLACALAGCATTTVGQAVGGASHGATLTAQTAPASATAMLHDYVPGWLRSGCADTGNQGRHPLVTSGFSDSLACVLRADTQAEVDYYRYASSAQTRIAYSAASAAGLAGARPASDGCAVGRGNSGQWSDGGAPIGSITCAARPGGGGVLIWDDPRTGIVAVASSPVLIPAALHGFWTVDGASIDLSAVHATSA